ncbi:MAG: DUF4038 domain-containing protein [Lentisphaerae bacterium]|nr:DUF4038 domain-containing protein [Lentisphaerota bacterium]
MNTRASAIACGHIHEWGFVSTRRYPDPFNELELDVVFRRGRRSWRVPAFWAGGARWRVRFSPPEPGRYTFETRCPDVSNAGLYGQRGHFRARRVKPANRLSAHGALRVAAGGRHLEHADGTPFLWLGDTWWMGLTKRLGWPADFKQLTADRVAKGFNVVQIIAGLYPDMPAFDPRGANEAGFPWEKDYARINPAYFDRADRRIAWLVRGGLMPCIVGCWGYFLPWMGVAKMKQHWRYLIARWGAHPVVWCLAGEAAMPYYLAEDKERATAQQKQGWTDLAAYVRQIDPFQRLVTIHPTDHSRSQLTESGRLDFEMLQTGHSDRYTLPNHVTRVSACYALPPRMPMLVSEVCYEGIHAACHEDVQRSMFWTAILSGACGHTYGANGIWQVNGRKQPYGPSPHGMAWGNLPWDKAMALPGSANLGRAKAFLARFPWWQMEPHPEWIAPSWTVDAVTNGYCAGIPRALRIAYFPSFPWGRVAFRGLERGVRYRGFLVDPATHREYPLPPVKPDANGEWQVQEAGGHHKPLRLTFPLYQDWLVVLERAGVKNEG